MAQGATPPNRPTAAPPVRVAVVIVSYRTRELLERCLRALAAEQAREAAWLDCRVLVVDNAGGDDSAAMVRRTFPDVDLVESAENLGFARANNLALRRLGLLPPLGTPDAAPGPDAPEFAWLLNPDTEVQAGALATLVRTLQTQPNAAACGPRLAYGDGAFQHGAFAWPGAAQVLIDLLPLQRLPGAARLRDGRLNGRYGADLWQGRVPFAVDFVLGAAMMVRSAAVRALGGLDEGYFMYCEEMDWCLRAHEAGWNVLAAPAALVVHHEGRSSRQTPWPTLERLWRSRLRFYTLHRRRFGPLQLPLVRLLLGVEMKAGIARARRAFALGAISGTAAGNEIAVRRRILAL